MKEETMTEEKNNEEQPEEAAPETELEKIKQEAADYKLKYLHMLADVENARKRMQKDRDELVKYATSNLLLDFLHPIDHLENALRFTEEASDEVKHWATGFKMILNQFKDVLVNNGVKQINAKGQPFDPHLHEAVEMVETSAWPPGTVVEESVKGYTIGEKTLRPSRVKVSVQPAKEGNDEEQLSEEKQES